MPAMPGVLKYLIAKLKRRRKSQSRKQKSVDVPSGNTSQSPIQPVPEGAAELPSTPVEFDARSPLSPAVSRHHVFGSMADFEFEFGFSAGESRWPGPPYDKRQIFAPGTFNKPRATDRKSKSKSFKRKMSQDGKTAKQTLKDQAKLKIARGREKKAPKALQYYGSAPTRDPPNHFLNLPGEIRNQIYRLLYLEKQPIMAHFRPVIMPKTGRHGVKSKEVNRRFPREPGLALVCRQLHREVLGFFYSANRFIFRRAETEKLKKWIMTNPDTMKLWRPQPLFLDSLQRIELHFTATTTAGNTEYIKYIFTKLAGEKVITSDYDFGGIPFCTCFDEGFLEHWKAREATEGSGRDLMHEAMRFVSSRTQWLEEDNRMHRLEDVYILRYRTKCSDCGWDTFRELGIY